MTNSSDFIPYNVLSTPEAILSNADQLSNTQDSLTSIWEEFAKSGDMQRASGLMQNILQQYANQSLNVLSLIQFEINTVTAILGIGPVAPFLNIFIGWLWPKLIGSNAPSIFDQIMRAVTQMMEGAFLNFTLNNLQAQINGIENVLSHFNDTTLIAIGRGQKPGVANLDTTIPDCNCSNPPCTPCPTHITDVKTAFENARNTIEAALPLFKDPLNNVIPSNPKYDNVPWDEQYLPMTLPLYTMVATFDIVLHNSYIQFAEKYRNVEGQTAITQANLDQVKADLRKIIKTYSNDIYTTFNQHLPKIDTNTNTKGDLNVYIQYTRSLTLTCLDIVATWPAVDSYDYPIQTQQTLSRIIFNDIVGPVETHPGNNPNDPPIRSDKTVELNLTQLDGKTSQQDIRNYFYEHVVLKSIQFQTYKISPQKCYVNGFQASYQKEDGGSTLSVPANGGTNTTLGANLFDTFPLLTRFNIASCQVSNTVDSSFVFMDYVGDKNYDFTPALAGCRYDNPGYGPRGSQNLTDYSDHKITGVYQVKAKTGAGYNYYQSLDKTGYLTALAPIDTVPFLTIKDSTVISAYPAELTSSSVQKSIEYVNGAAVVRLQPRLDQAQYNVICTAPGLYNIRVRLASNNLGGLKVTINNVTSKMDILNTSTAATDQTGIVGAQGTYMLFPTLTFDNTSNNFTVSGQTPFNISPGSQMMTIENTSTNAEILLDRIEFIPNSLPKPGSPIHQSVPETHTVPNTTRVIWSSKTDYSRMIAFKGTVTNSGSITIQLLDGSTVVDEFPISGAGVGLTKTGTTMCVDKQYPYSYPTMAIRQKFNKVQIVEHSDYVSLAPNSYQGYAGCDATLFGNSYNAEIDIKFDLSAATDLEQITQQVNNLFTSSSNSELASTVSSCQINQVAMKVRALSDEVFCKEKALLRKLVNKAKQFLKARNLLVSGDFETLNEWLLGTQATIKDDSPLFNGNYLFLQPTNRISSSYAYQKVDESKLKPYTRYKISGFIGQSEQVELVVSRYGKEVDKILNVPYAAALPITSGTDSTCCAPETYQCPACDGSQPDSHFFSYSIDAGTLYPELNPGIEFGLRIAQQNGYATVSNLEIVEERPLTGKEVQTIQRKEQKWKKVWDKERAEISALLQPIIDRINSFFKDADWNGPILPHVTYQSLSNVVLPALPKLRHWFMNDREGEHYHILQQFKQALERVFTQLEEQNLIHNGSFTNGLTDWLVEGYAQITLLANSKPALQLSDWDASASQSLDISDFDENKQYKLRVYAKGTGTITVENCEGSNPVSFDTDTFTSQEQTFYFDTPSFVLRMQSESTEFVVGSVELIELSDEDTNE